MCTKNGLELSEKIIELARYFNNYYFALLAKKTTPTPLTILENNVDQVIGLLTKEIEEKLVDGKHFQKITSQKNPFVRFAVDGFEERSKIFSDLLNNWRSEGNSLALRGWRGENFEVKASSHAPNQKPLFLMERSATCLFGLRQFGVDINGYVRHPQRGLCLWLSRRAKDKPTWPGKMDNMVGGGLSHPHTILQTAIKEAQEEAGIPTDYLQNLKSAGAVSFYFQSERGLFPNTEFVYDLELPLGFVPENQDGEVESFELVEVEEALKICLGDEFKTTSCPVTLDFLVRWGVIEGGVVEGLSGLLHVDLNGVYGFFCDK